MAGSPSSVLRRLLELKDTFGDDAGPRKLALLRTLARRRLTRAGEVHALHDALCFLRAYPDDGTVLTRVEEMLAAFSRRSDLRHHADDLADTGIAGTPSYYAYYWFTARWLAERWPDRITIDWEAIDGAAEAGDDGTDGPVGDAGTRLEEILHLLTLYGESLALDELGLSIGEWLARMKGPDETDAHFLVQRFEALPTDAYLRETLYESIDVPLRLAPGPDTPTRTHARAPQGRTPQRGAPHGGASPARISFQRAPFSRVRPALDAAVRTPPRRIRRLSPREGDAYIELARALMVSHSRDLLLFFCADRRDVRLLDHGGGVVIACYGAVPERRLLLESLYGFVVLKNGVPIGYGTLSALFGSTAVANNVFDTFRGGESATIFGHVLSTARALFDADSFALDPYQLGHDNREGLESGAWWFYYKLGFRPHDAGVRRLVREEQARMKRRPGHRTSIDTLNELTAEPMFLHLEQSRPDVLGQVSLGNIGLRLIDHLAARHGSDRETAEHTAQEEAAERLGLASLRGFKVGERLAWRRWAPLVASLSEVERWPAESKQALIEVVRAKGGRRESDFVNRFDAHVRLRAAVLQLAHD